MILYIDLDEVLVDTTDSLLLLKGIDNPYDDPQNLGKRQVHKLVNQSWQEFWEALAQEEWASLPKFWWADRLIELANRLESDKICTWRFLTSPIMTPECFAGKSEWVIRNYPQHANKLIIGRNKQDIVGTEDLLIDDSEENLKHMRAGGKDVNMFLFPAKTNKLHLSIPSDETGLEKLVDEIEQKALLVSITQRPSL
jgi:5'(3')-deoxyribonucleotidase